MYLSDIDIKKRLNELNIECNDPNHSFSVDEQIQPCSIDLRLSTVFWEPMRGETIDLRKRVLMELEPRRYYKRISLKPNEYITLKPGKMLIASTYEKFTVPKDCAAKVEGRSSFGRLGVSVHCTGDFANPGYRGNFPLILTNNSPTSIRLFSHIPICQLMLIPLSSIPTRLYGESVLQSKYMDDDGGPSYWWRYKRIQKLQETFEVTNVDIALQKEFLECIGIQEPEVILRFEKFYTNECRSEFGSASQVLQAFVDSEDSLRNKSRHIRGAFHIIFAIVITVSGGLLFFMPYEISHYIIWLLLGLLVYPYMRTISVPETTYYGNREHNNYKRDLSK